jgi:predicted Rossmann-fold nucleotide-binding protein
MGAVSEAFAREPDREGLVLAVLPGDASGASPTGYPNPWVELPIRTHLPLSGEQGTDALSRNHLNVLTADVLVALPGSAGTRSEIELALRYARPIVRHARDEGVEGVQTLPDLEDVLAFVREHASS